MRARIVWSCAIALVLLTASAVPAASGQHSEDWRKTPPTAGPARPLTLPPVHETRLENGLTLLVVEDHRAPIVTIEIAVPAGEAKDPKDSPGLAEATADLLTEGAAGLTSQELARKVEALGGRLSSFSGADFAELSISALAQTADQMIKIAADVLLKPDFPDDEIALYKSNRIQNLIAQRQDPGFLVSEQFDKIIYGSHPYSISAPTPASVSALNRKSIQEFYRANYSPAGAVAVIAGDFGWQPIESKAKEALSGWKAAKSEPAKVATPPARSERQVYLLDRPGSAQADIRVGNLALDRTDKDYIPMIVANSILGGGTSSRLFLDIREQKGYTYDVGSYVSARKQYGTFFGATETRTEVAGAAIKEMLAQFERMRAEKVTPADLQHAKNFINGTFSLSLSTQGSLAEQLLRTWLYNLGPDYLRTFRSRVDAVTVDEVQRAAEKYISADRCAVVVVGDAAKLKDQLKSLGPVVVLQSGGTNPGSGSGR